MFCFGLVGFVVLVGELVVGVFGLSVLVSGATYWFALGFWMLYA